MLLGASLVQLRPAITEIKSSESDRVSSKLHRDGWQINAASVLCE